MMKYYRYICLGCLVSVFFINTSFAFSWRDLWLRPDQQAQQALKKGNAKQAAQLFKQPDWRAVANYRAKHYKQAAATLKHENTPLAHYNRGNALAHLGQYRAAINAYEQALKLQANYPDAKYNRDLLKKLLAQQNKQQQPPQQQPKQQQKQQQKKPQQQNQNQRQQSQQQGKNQPQHQGNNQSQQQNQQKQSAQQGNDQSQQQNQQKQSAQQGNDQSQQQHQQQPKAQQQAKRQQQPKQQRQPVKPKRSRAQRLKDWQAKQWLDQIPDDPGGLLRQKFLRDYQRRIIKGRQTS